MLHICPLALLPRLLSLLRAEQRQRPAALCPRAGVAAQHGVLIKSAEALEKMSGLAAVVFDKASWCGCRVPAAARSPCLEHKRSVC